MSPREPVQTAEPAEPPWFDRYLPMPTPPLRQWAWDDTQPLALAVCPGCLDGHHTWSLPGRKDFGRVELARYGCVCDTCFGRCDGVQVRVTRLARQPRAHRHRRHFVRPPLGGHPR